MKFPAYPRYKPSGVEWLGDVPEHWEVKRIKYAAQVESGHTPSRSNEEWWVDCTIPWVSLNDSKALRESDYISETRYQISELGLLNSSARLLPARAVVFSRDATVGLCSITTRLMAVSQHFIAYLCKPELYPEYLLLGLKAMGQELESLSLGTTIPTIGMDDIYSLRCPVPPLPEQQAIAVFLDRETGRIDGLVTKKRELIERLKEKRTALISRTVTGGLSPDAALAAGFPGNPPIKPSGLDWLGDIPAHWTTKTIRRVTGQITNGFVGPTRDILRDEGVRYIQSLHVKKQTIKFGTPYYVENEWSDAHARSILRKDDLVIVQTGGCTGEVAIVPEDFDGSNCHALIILKSSKRRGVNRYLLYVMISEYGRQSLESVQTGALHPHLNSTIVCDIVVPSPPLPEQVAIAAYLDVETSKLDSLLTKVEEAVERLQEYRTALITAAVTGKIDVRETSLDEGASRPRESATVET